MGLKITADGFAKIAAGIQSIAVVIGVMIGGWWTLQTFVFENPEFYQRGSQDAGLSPPVVNATLFAERLGATGRDYAVTLTVANSSKTWGQLVWGARTKIIYFQPGDDKSYQALFFSTLPSQPAMEVPPLQSRQLQFLATFPDDGVYVLEVDLCRQFGGNCLVQKYISVGKGG